MKFYNTGKLLIGVYHQPKQKNVHTREDDFWQGVLLGDRVPLVDRMINWLYRFFFVSCVAAVGLAIVASAVMK